MQDASLMFGIVMVSMFAGALGQCLYDDRKARRERRKLRKWLRNGSA